MAVCDTNGCSLSRYETDLNMKCSQYGYDASPRTDGGFANLWAGAKATHGVSKGRVCFQVKIQKNLDVPDIIRKTNVRDSEQEQSADHVVRVGWSTGNASLELGYTSHSYGYGSTGKKKSHSSYKFIEYGECFGEGDIITAYLDFDSDHPTISFWKSGIDLGVAFTITDDLQGQALFPHVMVKNAEVELNFGQKPPYHTPQQGFTLIGSLPEEDVVLGPMPPDAEKAACEVLMLVGLPGSGKTTWAEKNCKEHPEKKYHILGTNNIMDKMKVEGLRRVGNYRERHRLLYNKANECMKELLKVAATRRGNYILDQPNMYPDNQLCDFVGFNCKAIIVVPSDEDFEERYGWMMEKRTFPEEEMLEMIDNFELPEEGPPFSDIQFVELQRQEARELLQKYCTDGRWGCGSFGSDRQSNQGTCGKEMAWYGVFVSWLLKYSPWSTEHEFFRIP